MVKSAALLMDEVLLATPIRPWVLTVHFPLRFLVAAHPELMSRVLTNRKDATADRPVK